MANILQRRLEAAISGFKAEFIIQILIYDKRYWSESEPGRSWRVTGGWRVPIKGIVLCLP